jgi:hypothetical protein
MISFLVPFYGDDPVRLRLLREVTRELRQWFPDDEVLVGGPGEPSRAVTRNWLAQESSGDILAFVDADTIIPPTQVRAAAKWITDGEVQWVLPYQSYYSLTEAGTAAFLHGDPSPETDYVFPSPEAPEPSVGGVIMMTRSAFATVNGYDERFIGWGEEDRAFAMALSVLVGLERRISGLVYHLWHPAPESVRFHQSYFEHNRALCNRYREAYNGHDVAAMRGLVTSA